MAVQLVSISSQARGIKFYDVPAISICIGTRLSFQLEPSNPWDANCISVWTCTKAASLAVKLGHLARETACNLAPLLRSGLVATGSVTSNPYSLSRSKWHGHRVSSVSVIVEGPYHRLQEVQTALGREKNFVTLTDLNTTHDSDSETDSDVDIVPDTNCDSKRTNSEVDYVLIDSDSSSTHDTESTLPLTPTQRDSDATTPTDSDTTPVVTPPNFRRMTSTYRQDTDSDATPLVTPPNFRQIPTVITRRRRSRPKQLF